MLSIFPSLLSWGEVSPLLIRLALGLVFVHWAYVAFRKHGADSQTKIISIIEGIAGLLIVVGLWTQVATLILAIDLVVRLIKKIQAKSFLTDGVNYYLILLILSLSLLVTGAGILSVDLPL